MARRPCAMSKDDDMSFEALDVRVNPITASPERSIPAAPPWNGPKKFLFRLSFLYLALYSLPFPLQLVNYLPWPWAVQQSSNAAMAYESIWRSLVPWVGANVLKLPQPITIFPNGSGDTTYNYVEVLCFAVFSLAGATVWTLIDRWSRRYDLLHDLLRVYVRWVLATTMFGYGFAKVIKTQFPFPSMDRLLEPYGESSPMGLLWTFMGYSIPYNSFTGAVEVLGGLFLLPRRTATLGALITAAAMVNVVMLNFCFDVPVKLYSSHLLLMSIFLLLPETGRLVRVLVLNQGAPPGNQRALLPWPAANWGARIIKSAVVVGLVYLQISGSLQMYQTMGDGAKKDPFFALYNVEEFSRDGASPPPLLTDSSRWRRVSLESRQYVSIRTMDNTRYLYSAEWNTQDRKVTLTPLREAGALPSVIRYSEPEPGRVVLEGRLRGEEIVATLKRVDPKEFLLVNRGFNWINEFPFNR